MHLLIIEDEAKTAAYLKKGFKELCLTAEVAEDGESGLQRALTGDFDLVILDVMLPKRDGWSVITELRRKGKETPVIMLTARDQVTDRIKGLELGVDDYLGKPFSFFELYARIRTILRRGPAIKQDVVCVEDLEIDLVRQKVTRGGKRLDLTQKEFTLLLLLARRAGEVISKLRIAELVWNADFDSFEKTAKIIDVHMARLRAKVDASFEQKLIQTVRGRGYVLEKNNAEPAAHEPYGLER